MSSGDDSKSQTTKPITRSAKSKKRAARKKRPTIKKPSLKRGASLRKKKHAEAPARSGSADIPVLDDLQAEHRPVEVVAGDAKVPAVVEVESRLPAVKKSTGSKDLVPYSPLPAYLREMRQYPPLSREEEHELAIKYREHGDLDAAYRLVSGNLWLVVKIAREYERAARSLLDLIQEGNIGLMEAVKNFDPHRGVRLPSYAVWWIKAYIIRYVIANWRMVKIGTTQAQRKLFFNLQKEKEQLEREGFFPAPKLIAERLDVKESEVIEMQQRLGSPDVSVDAPVGRGEDTDLSLLGLLPSEEVSAEEALATKQLHSLLGEGFQKFSETLNHKERTIFQKRLTSEKKATLQVLSEELEVSRERVRQIEARVKEKLKDFLIEHYGQAIEGLDF